MVRDASLPVDVVSSFASLLARKREPTPREAADGIDDLASLPEALASLP